MFQNRIVGQGEKAAKEFKLNTKNWRTHSRQQLKTINGLLEELGWVQGVIVNKTTGNLIDGHARITEAQKTPDALVPFVEVELTEAEESKILLLLDPVGTMAGADAAALEKLLNEVKSSDAFVSGLMLRLASENGIAPAAAQSMFEPVTMPEFAPNKIDGEDFADAAQDIYDQIHRAPEMTKLKCPYCDCCFDVSGI